MIQPETKLRVADNSGAKIVKCFKVLGGSRKRYAQIGDTIVASVKKAEPRKDVKKKDVVRGVVVRQRKPYRRSDGSYVRFDENAVVLIDNNKPIGTRVFGPIAREVRKKGHASIASLAEDII